MNYITVNYPTTASVQFEGYFYDYLSKVFLSSGDMFINLPSITAVDAFSNMPRISAICPAFSGYEYPSSLYNVDSKNILNVTIANLSGTGNADVILFNRAGYKKMSDFGYLLQFNPSNFLVNNLILSGALFQVNNFAVPSLGYYSLYDNGGGTLVWSSTSLATADQGSVIRPNNITSSQPGRWIRQFSGNQANVRMWGTVEDGVTDDQPALQRAIDYCSLSGINNLYFNSATYYFTLSSYVRNLQSNVRALTATSNWPNKFYPPYLKPGSYVGGYLQVGFYPGKNYYFNLNLIGTGNTILSTNAFNNSDPNPASGSLIFLTSNLTACRISGFTLIQDAVSATGNGLYLHGGINMGGYSPTATDASYFTRSKADTITIDNNLFINCHSAIGSQYGGGSYSSLSGTSLQNLIITNNTFRYPRGGDVYPPGFNSPNAGGTIVTLANTAVQNLSVINNKAEGTSSSIVNNTDKLPKDGFIFGSAVTSFIKNNILSGFGVEAMFCNCLGFSGPSVSTNITVPAVGQSITINFKCAPSNWTPYTFASYLCSYFVPNKYYDLLGAGYGGTNTSLGLYQIQQLLVPVLSNIATNQYNFSATFVSVSGVLGTDSWYNQYQTSPGLTAYAIAFNEYNPTGTYGVTVSGIGNTIIGGSPDWRSAMGVVFLSGNTFISTLSGNSINDFTANLFMLHHPDPTGYQIITNNSYYMYNQLPSYTSYLPSCILIGTSGSQVYNNNFYLWVDSTITSTTAVNTYTPQIYNNCNENLTPYIPANGYTPVYYNAIGMAYGTQNQHMQVYNNNFFISNPLSAQLLTLISSDNSSSTGYLTANTIYGNNVYFNNVNTAVDLRNVYSTNFNADINIYGGGRAVTLSAQNITINTNYRNTPGDGLGGTFVWVANSVLTDDGVSIIKPNKLTSGQSGRWVLQYNPPTVYNLIATYTSLQINNTTISASGYFIPGDNGDGSLIYSSTSLATADQGSVIRPNNITSSQPGRWIRQFSGNQANVRMWGTVEDGVTDDQPALQRAIDYCSLSGINNLYFNSGNYYLALSGLQTNSINQNKLMMSLSAWYPTFKNPNPAAGFVGGYLNVGYYPQLNYYFNLNLIGTGNTRLFSTQIPFKCYNDTLVCDLSASTCGYNGIFFLSSNLTACNISGFTLESTSLSSGNNMYANGGIIMGGYSPVQIDSSYFKKSKVNNITIDNNLFINCHSAIKGGQYSSLSGTSLQTLNILNNTFKYPRGADVINFRNPDNSGGTIVTLDNTAIQNLNVINNIAEGTSQLFQTTGNIAKDGFMFGSAITSLFKNNTLSSFGYESMYSNTLGFSYIGPYADIVVPSVGQSLTINFKFEPSNWTPYTAAQYLCASFIPSKYYDLAGDSYGGTNTSLGIYQLQNLLVPTLSNISTNQYNFSATFVCVSGVLGTSPWYNQYLNAFGAPGLTANAHNFFEYNPTGTYGITVSGINNNIYGGGFPWRSDMGNVFLSSNNFFISTSGLGGFNLFPFEHADPKAYQILSNNNYYMYNYLPTIHNYVPTCISISTSGSQIYNNNFYLWVDSTNTSTTAINTYMPQIYNNCDESLNPYVPANGFKPTYYNPICLSYGTIKPNNQVFNNNIFISNPLSAQLVVPFASNNSTVAGYLTANNIYNNNIIYSNVNSVKDLRNVYSTTFNNDQPGNGGQRWTTLSSQNITINTNYRNTPGDGLGGTFVWVASSTAPDDGGITIKPNARTSSQPGRWIRQFNSLSASVALWGAIGDGVTNDQPAIQAAIDYCSLNNVPNLYFNAKTYFLSSFAITAYENTYLSIGYYPGTGKMVNINLLGTGNTILSANNRTYINGVTGNITAIFSILENLSTCSLSGFILKNDGVLCGDTGSVGIAIRGNTGGSFGWGTNANYAIGRDTITIQNNTFINCHRAINSQSSYLTAGGTKNLNVLYNTFLYPKGSDSANNSGGSQIMFTKPDTLNYNVIGNIVEGTTTVPVNSPNNFPKDGFVFYTGINSKIANNTLSRMWVETIYSGQSWDGFSIGTVTMSAVGTTQTYTVNVDQNSDIDALTANGGFNINSYVVIPADSTGNDGGIYQINSYPYRGRTNSGSTTAFSIQMTRVSGVDAYPYNLFANSRVVSPGTILTNKFIKPYGRSYTIGCSSYVVDNFFTIGLAVSSSNGLQLLSHNPAIRSDVGFTYLSGNKIYAGIYPAVSIEDPRTNWLIEKNDFYVYNELPVSPAGPGVTHYEDTIAGVSPLKATIRNNNMHFWVDINGNTTTAVNSAVPQTYINNPPYYQPTYYAGFNVNYAYFGWNQGLTNPGDGQTYINNNTTYSVAGSANLIIPFSQTSSGINLTSNIYNTVSGNTITFGS